MYPFAKRTRREGKGRRSGKNVRTFFPSLTTDRGGLCCALSSASASWECFGTYELEKDGVKMGIFSLLFFFCFPYIPTAGGSGERVCMNAYTRRLPIKVK